MSSCLGVLDLLFCLNFVIYFVWDISLFFTAFSDFISVALLWFCCLCALGVVVCFNWFCCGFGLDCSHL